MACANSTVKESSVREMLTMDMKLGPGHQSSRLAEL